MSGFCDNECQCGHDEGEHNTNGVCTHQIATGKYGYFYDADCPCPAFKPSDERSDGDL